MDFIVYLYREVEMAHKVLAKDMSELVSTMRLAQQYSETTLDIEYRKWVVRIKIILQHFSRHLLLLL